MGIPNGTARLLLEEHRVRSFRGSLLQIGRSSVYFTWKELEKWADLHGVRLNPVPSVQLSHDPRLARLDCIDDRTLFTALGFDRVEACDISDWEGAEHLVDLNMPVPDKLVERYDVLLDAGSSPEIFHQPNLLQNGFRVLKPGGRVIHAAVPSNNHFDQGFYMTCPTLFRDFYRCNGWRIDVELLSRYSSYWHRGRFLTGPWKVYRYTPGCLDHFGFCRPTASQLALFFVATKAPGATGHRIPQLGSYERRWSAFEARRAGEDSRDAGLAAGELPPAAGSGARLWLEDLADRLCAGSSAADRFLRACKRHMVVPRRLLRGRMPELVARY